MSMQASRCMYCKGDAAADLLLPSPPPPLPPARNGAEISLRREVVRSANRDTCYSTQAGTPGSCTGATRLPVPYEYPAVMLLYVRERPSRSRGKGDEELTVRKVLTVLGTTASEQRPSRRISIS
jgi:hypothetical protein